MTNCPSDEIFTRLVEGLLPEAEVRALEAHCDGCIGCAHLLAELARSISPSGGAGGLLDDRYRLLEPLGAGGMGVVYAAFDTKLGRKVAVKRLRETGQGTPAEKRRGRFMREAQLLASLSHPNVLTIHDVGGADRELYVVMELVDGAPISRWLIEQRPGWRAIVDVFMQAGRGLVAAHQLGIVHRDIKPDNILVANNGRVLVGDFGLAGLAGNLTPVADPSPSPGPPPSLTQTGAVLGTPAYMSPEQHDGKTGDALSDQFSFAVSLYESLHRRRPFAGRSAGEIAAATRAGQLAPPGDGVPRAIDRVLSVALAPEPSRRYASMEDLLAALERARTRRPVAAALTAAVVLLAAGAVGARVWSHHPTPPVAPPPAVVQAPTAKQAPVQIVQKEQQGGPEAQRTDQTKNPDPPSVPPHLPVNQAGSAPSGGPSKHKRQLAQASPPATALPASGDAKEMLDRADRLADKRDGAGCLAVMEQIRDVPADMVARANIIRGDCEMLAGHCEAGRKILEPMYEADRHFTPATAKGVLSARVARMCPVSAFPTVGKRLLAVSLQADEAKSAAGEQSRWCGALERALLADTQSPEVQSCFADRKTGDCPTLRFNLERAYEHLAECFLRDKNCREGARLDVMHSQVEFGTVDVANKRINLFCRPDRVVEVYPACTPEGDEVQRKCLERVEAARQTGEPRVSPVLPSR
jgi:hypothetical protein